MATALPVGSGRNILRVVSGAELSAQENLPQIELSDEKEDWSQLARYVRNEFDQAKASRNAEGTTDRLLKALRIYRGKYDAQTLADIEKFGGSKVFSRMVSVKCRGASALLRDVFLTGERPWEVRPTPKPTIPDNIMGRIMELVAMESQTLMQAGQTPDPEEIQDRIRKLEDAARASTRKRAEQEAEKATRKLNDVLTEGEFYRALQEFLDDLPVFPYAVIKGPIVRMKSRVKWVDGVAERVTEPRMFWNRVSPFDVWWTPGSNSIQDAAIFERVRYRRQDLVQMRGVEGYDQDAVTEALRRFDDGHLKTWFSDEAESERADLEERDQSRGARGVMEGIEYHGYISGHDLNEFVGSELYDEEQSYFCDVYLLAELVLKININPSPRERVPYYISSFDKVPGTMAGNGLPDILEDILSVANATLRALVNNLSIASGPQAVVRRQLLDEQEDGQMYPWKQWMIDESSSLPGQSGQRPVEFFQPQSNSQELLMVYKEFTNMADEVSAIPRYLTGSSQVGGAGRTASGLAMLMNNASKVMQNVAYNIDHDILEPCIQMLYEFVLLTDETGMLRGDEEIVVKGVTTSIQREQDRVRQLELLQITANQFDMPLMGLKARHRLLGQIARNVGVDLEADMSSEEEVMALIQQMQAGPDAPAPNEGSADGQQPHLNTVGTRNTV